MKSDVKKYYASLDHDILMNLIREYVNESPVTQLIFQFLKHVKYRDGSYADVRRGICRGTALSPLLGALYLKPLDQAMGKMNVAYAYVRYMDDWIVMSTNRWTFARAVKKVNRTLNNLKLEKAEDKTFIGTIKRGSLFTMFFITLRVCSKPNKY
jgi:RNA-directed DNA polymerase